MKKSDEFWKEHFQEMAELKLDIKELEVQYKELESVALDRYGKKYLNEYGSFSPTKRENWKVDDKCKVVEEMTLKVYKEHSTISKTGIIAGVGQKGFDKLVDKGAVSLGSTSEFYTFREKKAASK